MTTLSNFETLFEPKILQRGREYHHDHAVKNLKSERINGKYQWTATVRGTNRYQVRCSLTPLGSDFATDFAISDLHCTCDYWDNCKHLVAFLLTLQETVEKEIPTVEKIINERQTIASQLNNYTAEELRTFILSLMDKQPSVIQEWIFWASQFLQSSSSPKKAITQQSSKKDEQSTPSKRQVLASIYQRIDDILDVQNFDEDDYYESYYDYDWGKKATPFEQLLAQFDRQPTLQLEACVYWVNQLIDYYAPYLDESDIDEMLTPALIVFGKVIFGVQNYDHVYPSKDFTVYTSKIDSEMAGYLRPFFDDWQQVKGDCDSTFQRFWFDFLVAQQEFDTLKTWLNQKIALYQKQDSYALNEFLMLKLAVLQHLKQFSEVNAVLVEFQYLPKIRQIMVNNCLKDGHIEQAIHLIQDGIDVAKKRNHNGTVKDWESQLINIAEKYPTNIDKNSLVRKYHFEQVFRYGSINEPNYHAWKATFTNEEWLKERDKLQAQLLEKLPKPDNSVRYSVFDSHSDVAQLAQFYDLEQQEQLLVALLKRHQKTGLLMKYASILAKYDSDWLTEIFKQKWQKSIEQVNSRTEYAELSKQISQMLTAVPAGKAVWQPMVEAWKERFRRKPALLDELGKIKF